MKYLYSIIFIAVLQAVNGQVTPATTPPDKVWAYQNGYGLVINNNVGAPADTLVIKGDDAIRLIAQQQIENSAPNNISVTQYTGGVAHTTQIRIDNLMEAYSAPDFAIADANQTVDIKLNSQGVSTSIQVNYLTFKRLVKTMGIDTNALAHINGPTTQSAPVQLQLANHNETMGDADYVDAEQIKDCYYKKTIDAVKYFKDSINNVYVILAIHKTIRVKEYKTESISDTTISVFTFGSARNDTFIGPNGERYVPIPGDGIADTVWYKQADSMRIKHRNIVFKEDSTVNVDEERKKLTKELRWAKGEKRFVIGIGGGPLFAYRQLVINNKQFTNVDDINNRRNNETYAAGGAANLYFGLAKNGHYFLVDAMFLQQGFNTFNKTKVNWQTGLLSTDSPATKNNILRSVGIGAEYSYRSYRKPNSLVATIGAYWLYSINGNINAANETTPKGINNAGFKFGIGYSYKAGYCFELRVQPVIYYNLTFIRSSEIKTRFYNPGLQLDILFNTK